MSLLLLIFYAVSTVTTYRALRREVNLSEPSLGKTRLLVACLSGVQILVGVGTALDGMREVHPVMLWVTVIAGVMLVLVGLIGGFYFISRRDKTVLIESLREHIRKIDTVNRRPVSEYGTLKQLREDASNNSLKADRPDGRRP